MPKALQRPQLNWSHFKPEYTGKPDEDAEAHPPRMNDWMDTHEFPEHIKVQRFCLTLVGEARLWHEPIRLINVNWVDFTKHFLAAILKNRQFKRTNISHVENISL